MVDKTAADWQKAGTLVFFDLEATGLTGCKITELSLVAVHVTEFADYAVRLRTYIQAKNAWFNGAKKSVEPSLPRVMNKLSLAVCPRQLIPPHVEDLTGLNNYNLEHQAAFRAGVGATLASFLALLARPVCLVAHNGHRFDFPLLKRELDAADIQLEIDLLVCDSWHFFVHFYTGERVGAADRLPFSPVAGGNAVTLCRSLNSPGSRTPDRKDGRGLSGSPCTPQKCESEVPSPLLTPPRSAGKKRLEAEEALQTPSGSSHLKHLLLTSARRKYLSSEEALLTPPGSGRRGQHLTPGEVTPSVLPGGSARRTDLRAEGNLLHLRKKLVSQEEFCCNVDSPKEETVVAANLTVAALESFEASNGSEIRGERNVNGLQQLEERDEKEEPVEVEDEDDVYQSYERYCQQLRAPPAKYSLGQVYRHFYGRDPEASHGAEADCMTLLQATAVCGTSFITWLTTSTTSFQDVKKR